MSSEGKDRLGDKLKKREKAEEDRYFAQQDAAKVAALKSAGEQEAGAGKMDCPRCGVKLDQEVLEGVTIDRCGACGGMWLDRGELETLAERTEEAWFSKWVRNVLGAR